MQNKKHISLADAPVGQPTLSGARTAEGMRFREARVRVPDGINCELKWSDYYGVEVRARVIDLSRYGCRVALAAEAAPKLYSKISKAQIVIDGAMAYKGSIVFVNEKVEKDGFVSAGVTFDQTGCDLESLSAAIGVKNLGIEEDFKRISALSANIRDSFKILVSDLNALLQEALQKLEAEEQKIDRMNLSDNHRFRLEERVITIAVSIYGPKLQAMLYEFQNLVQTMSVDEEAEHKKYFRINFQQIVKGTPFVDRSIKKPLGYSGDYGMMVMLYEYFDQGNTLFHRFFHRFVCSEPAAVANKNRVGFLSDILMSAYEQAVKNGQKEFNVVSVACGPAREIYEFLKYAPLNGDMELRVVLIDTEEHALDYAQSRLRELTVGERKVDLVFLKEDAVTGVLQEREFIRWFQNADAIISAGLFDYLTDRVSQRMINGMAKYLRVGGQLLIGNISKRSPDVFAMDYFMDWRLILRDEPDLLKLVNPEYKNDFVPDVISESLGLNLFLRVTRKK